MKLGKPSIDLTPLRIEIPTRMRSKNFLREAETSALKTARSRGVQLKGGRMEDGALIYEFEKKPK